MSLSKTIIVIAILILISNTAAAGQLEDGFVAYKQGDNELAYKKWLPLAIEGDVRAQFFLSVLLDNRTGGPEDEDNAKKWLTASANNGFVPARFNLGNNYHKGKYGTVNNKMAEYWWNQAAVQGFAEAQYHLATLYYWGKRGVKLDLKEAFYWFEQAAKQGFQEASEALLLIRAGEPLQPPNENEPANIAYDDPRIVSRLSLDHKQMAAGEQQKKQVVRKKTIVSVPKPSEEIVEESKDAVTKHSDKDWVSQQPATNYTIQLFASTKLSECGDQTQHLYRSYRLETHVQSFMKDNRKYCAVIYGSHGRQSGAKVKLSQLPVKIKQAKPWIRKIAR